MNPDQTASKGAVRSGFIVFAIKTNKVYKEMREQDNKLAYSLFVVAPTHLGPLFSIVVLGVLSSLATIWLRK